MRTLCRVDYMRAMRPSICVISRCTPPGSVDDPAFPFIFELAGRCGHIASYSRMSVVWATMTSLNRDAHSALGSPILNHMAEGWSWVYARAWGSRLPSTGKGGKKEIPLQFRADCTLKVNVSRKHVSSIRFSYRPAQAAPGRVHACTI